MLSSSGTPVAVLDGADSHISSQSGAHAESSVFDIEGMCPVQDNPSLVQTFYGLGVRWMLIAYNHSNSDELIRACARKGGVVGLSGIGPYLGTSTRLRERFLDQLRYVIDLVGTPHVGLCLDYVFDCAELNEFIRHNPTLFSADMDTAAGMPMIEPEAIGEIVEGLLRDNLTDEQIREVLGLNWLRVARQVWK